MFNCYKKGHYKSTCPNKKRNGKDKKSHFKECANVVVPFDNYKSAGVFVSDTQRSWVMDSGCTYRMCLVKEFFKTL